MAKSKKKQEHYVIPVDTVKLLLLFVLTVILAASLYVLFSDPAGSGDVQLIEPTTVQESESTQ